MNKIIEEYRKEFIKSNFVEKVYLSKEEYEKLESQEDILYDRNKSSYYKNVPMEILDDELNTYVSLKMLENSDNIRSNIYSGINHICEEINIIKGIMIFWLILTIISLIGSIYTAVKIGGLIGR